MEFLFASAAETATGAWFNNANLGLTILVGMVMVGSLFAFRRDVEAVEKRFADKHEAKEKRLDTIEASVAGIKEDINKAQLHILEKGEERAVNIHARIEPLIIAVAGIKQGQETLILTIKEFTEAMRLNAETNKQQTAVLQALVEREITK